MHLYLFSKTRIQACSPAARQPARVWLAAALLVISASCSQSAADNYTISGNLTNAATNTVYLEENSLSNGQATIVDSATVQKTGAYHLSTNQKQEVLYSLRLAGDRYPFVSFVNDSRQIEINADFAKTDDPFVIKGSPGSEALKSFLFTISNKISALKSAAYAGDSIGLRRAQRDSVIAAVNRQEATSRGEVKNYVSGFIASAQSAPLFLYALSTYQSIAANEAFGLEPFSDEQVKEIVDRGVARFPKHPALVAIQKQISRSDSAALPARAPGFTLPDTAGQLVSLSSLRGRFVLVDFWASWCPPCRAENPNVVAAYRQFKDKNFTLLGVSLDNEKAPWLQAIAEDSLSWTHVSDLKYWNSMVVPLYNIEAIPYNVLLDTSGNIIGQNLRGADLQQKLREVLP